MDHQLIDSAAYDRVLKYRLAVSGEQERSASERLTPPKIEEDVESDIKSVADTEHTNGPLSPRWSPNRKLHHQRLRSSDATIISEPVDMYRSRNMGVGMRTVSSEPFRMEKTKVSSSIMTQTIQKKASWLSKLGRRNRSSVIGPSTSEFNNPPPESRRGRRVDSDLHSSINFSSPENLNVPPLVRAAQAGSIVEVEQLLDRGTDIEARHTSSGRNALAVAAHCGNDAVVNLLLQYGAKSTQKDASHSTCLHLAASRGHVGSVRLLLQDGVLVEERDAEDQTPLWLASSHGHLETVQVLLDYRAKVNTRAHGQLTSLHAAAKRGDAAMVNLLLSHGAHVDAKDDQLMTALHYACEAGHEAVVRVLLGKHADIEARGRAFQTPVICAASAGQIQIVELLLKRKATLKSKADKGMNSLHWASYNGHVEVVDLLISKKMPINVQNGDGKTSLHLAIISKRFDVVEYLLRKKADLEIRCLRSFTALHYACAAEEPGIVQILLGSGAHCEAATQDDGRPLHIAVSHGTLRTVQLLLERGVNMEARDKAEDRPLCLASYHGHVEIVEVLLDYGSPLRLRFSNRPKSHEDSPLCVAARQGHLDVCSVLMSRGASVRQKDELLWPPLRYAAYYGHPKIVQLLLSHGAEVSSVGASGGWGFEVTASRIGFATNVDISGERKQLVRELLKDAEAWEKMDREYQSSQGALSTTTSTVNQPSRAELTGNTLPPSLQVKGSTKYELLDKTSIHAASQTELNLPLPKYQLEDTPSSSSSIAPTVSPMGATDLYNAYKPSLASQPARSVSHVSALSDYDDIVKKSGLNFPELQVHEMSAEATSSNRMFNRAISRTTSVLQREKQREMDNEATKRYWEQEQLREQKRLEQEAKDLETFRKELGNSHLESVFASKSIHPSLQTSSPSLPGKAQCSELGDLPLPDIWGTRLAMPKGKDEGEKPEPQRHSLIDYEPGGLLSRPISRDDLEISEVPESPTSVKSDWSWKRGSG